MSCQMADRDITLSVCYDNEMAVYSYGKAGQTPELSLSEPVRTVDYVPWSGATREIAEGVDFSNADYTYRVYAGFRKLQADESDDDGVERHFGGVRVLQDDVAVATLRCDPSTVQFGYGGGLYDVKEAFGLEWDDRARAWVEGD